MDNRLIILGTGNAMVTRCFNTCFILESGDNRLMVDAGGGNGILKQMMAAGVEFSTIHHLYLTHAHTDHVMGAVWVVRKVTSLISQGRYDGVLQVYGHERVLHVLRTMCEMMLPRNPTIRQRAIACRINIRPKIRQRIILPSTPPIAFCR